MLHHDTGVWSLSQTSTQPIASQTLVAVVRLAHTSRLDAQVMAMHLTLRRIFSTTVLVMMSMAVNAADSTIIWPEGWEVESLSPEVPAADPPRFDKPGADGAGLDGSGADKPVVQQRQRAVKNDPSGNPVMVMELTQSRLQRGHKVNVEGVLLEMRKAVQVNFVRSGYQSVCTKMKETTLGSLSAVETTCTITQNGVHLMTQTLLAAASADTAWSLSYAGSAQGYADNKQEVAQIRDRLRFNVSP